MGRMTIGMRISRSSIPDQRGLSLLELLVVVTIAVVVASYSIVNLHDQRKDQAISNALAFLESSISVARGGSELAPSKNTILCVSSDGLSCSGSRFNEGWLVYTDQNENMSFDNGIDRKLAIQPPLDLDIQLNYSGSPGNSIFFSRDGVSSSGSFIACDDRGANYARGLELSPLGALRIIRGSLTC